MRRREAVCDSLLCTLVVVASVVAAVIVYRKNLRQLLKILFVGFLLFGAFVSTRHLFYRAARWLKCFLWRRRSREEKHEHEGPHPELEERKEEARQRAQETHDDKAEDYETRIAGPRREERLRKMEEQMRSVRGFRGEGHTLGGGGGGPSPASSAPRRRQLHDSAADSQRSQFENESHVTDEEEFQKDVKVVTLALRLRDRTVTKQFHITDKVQVLYSWMESLRYSPDDYCIATRLPKQLVVDTQRTLQDYGLISDTSLVVEERE